MRGWLDDLGGTIWEATHPDIVAQENAAMGVAPPEVIGAVDRFRNATRAFWNAYSPFTASYADAVQYGMEDEWLALEDRANTATGYITQIGEQVAGAWGWAKSTFGLAGMRGAMGVLPAIPIAYAVITAAIAWVLSITADMVKFNQRLSAAKAGVVLPPGEGTATGDIASMVKWGALALALIYVAPPVLKMIEGRK